MNYPYVFTNFSGILTQDWLNFNPLFIELTADVPDTWNTAGTIYIYKNVSGSRLLIGSQKLYFNFTHISLITEIDYSIQFKPIYYLEQYTLKIGTE